MLSGSMSWCCLGVGGVVMSSCHAWPQSYDRKPSHPYNVWEGGA